MQREAEAAEVVRRLDALSASGRLADRSRRVCTALLGNMQRPVRVGIFGMPMSGKRSLLAYLCPDTAPNPSLALPTLELSYSDTPELLAILSDGTSITAAPEALDDILEQAPAFIKLAKPDPQLQRMTLLLTVADKNPRDVAASLAWAAGRTDIAIWCTSAWDSFDQAIWQNAPEDIRHHAVLVLTYRGAGEPDHAAPEGNEFEGVFDASDTDSTTRGLPGLKTYLQDTIDEAREQDIHNAQLFLFRHGEAVTDVPPETEAAAEAPDISIVPDTSPRTPEVPDTPKAAMREGPAWRSLSRLIAIIRASGVEGYTALASEDDPDGMVETVFAKLEDVFETLADKVLMDDHIEDNWPMLAERVHSARDLAVLLRVEGEPEQLHEAALLLLQLRRDIEVALAA